MSRGQPTLPTAALGSGAGGRVAASERARAPSACGDVSAQDRAFIALMSAYRPHGGLMRLQGRVVGARSRSEGQACDVLRLVDAGELFSFQWHDAVWIPLFQFDMPVPRVAAGPQRVVAELGRDFDGWALASWFAQPNDWLASHSPIACLASRLPEVLEAARADRLVVAGTST